MALAVLLRLTKDTINHALLLQTLENLGVRGNALHIFRSYLADRKQFVQIENTKSLPRQWTIEYGVPQGTILYPVRFKIYVKSMTYYVNQSVKEKL